MLHTMKDVLALLRGLRGFRALFTISMFAQFTHQILLVLLSAVSVYISTRVVNETWLPGEAVWPLAIVIIMALVQGTAYLLECWWSHELAYKVLASLRVDIFASLQRIAPLGLQGRRIADVASRSMGDVEQLEWFYAHTVATAINAVTSSVILIAAGYWFMGPLALVVVPALISILAFPFVLLRWQRRQGDRHREALSALKVTALDGIHGLREMRTLGLVERQEERLEQDGRRVQRALTSGNLRRAVEAGFVEWVMAIVHLVVVIVLTGWLRDGTFPAQDLPVSVMLASMAAVPVIGLVGMLGKLGEIGACAHRVQALLDAPDTVDSAPRAGAAATTADGSLRIEDVTFRYGPELPAVLDGVSLEIPKGQTVALFGPSGVGKSTLAFLALRFLDPQAGVVRLDGVDVVTSTPDAHREHVTLLPQSSYIFAGTIRENLTIAAPEADDDTLWRALTHAGLREVVEGLGGLDAAVGDRGTTLSGGERQRLGLARVFLRDHEVLVLDEPLANVDPELEASIMQALAEHRSDASTLLIAHRISSLAHADRIIVLGSEGVVDQGTHAELAERCAPYRSALAAQAG